MSDSWGHTLERLGEQELIRLTARAVRERERWGDSAVNLCVAGRVTHREQATYQSTYSYVTGRAGRVSGASRLLCEGHARKFAAKHLIDWDDIPTRAERPEHASEQAP
jgi:hypothetical protein